MTRIAYLLLFSVLAFNCRAATEFSSPWISPAEGTSHTFTIGETAFLLDGTPLQIRCGELHFSRVPREYWRHRLRQIRAMGMNAVCAYLFWNYHEPVEGRFDWSGGRDIAEFCRLAQAEGLWVVLRPGPYVCAEWEMGGLPWWLLKDQSMQLRTRHPRFMEASNRYLQEVGRVLAPLQVTRGGPILLVQVENEYGFAGNDSAYMAELRDQLKAAGFEVPLFACNPPTKLKEGLLPDLFQVVNFGRDPAGGFKALREIQPTGPLMCGEFYPGWFDTWGNPHHLGDTDRYLADLEYMLKEGASFSIYMAHGGTTFGLWAGANRPFKPDTTSYDYDAPVSEAGWVGEKFHRTRELMKRHLQPGETLPEPLPPPPTIEIAPFELTEEASLFANLPAPRSEAEPDAFEQYDLAQGLAVYRTTIPAGPAATLRAEAAHDFTWAFLDGAPAGVMDRRYQHFRVQLPERAKPTTLELLVYSMGRVNFGHEIHDRKGLHGPVVLELENGTTTPVQNWQVHTMDLLHEMPALQWQPVTRRPVAAATPEQVRVADPKFWRGEFDVATPGDTFLDVSRWGKGIAWLNGRCLGRFWNIGPTQTMFVPAPWIRAGKNELVILDLLGPESPVINGRTTPILDQLRPEADFYRPKGFGTFKLGSVNYVHQGQFAPGPQSQEFAFDNTVEARQLCIESLSAIDGKGFAAIAEIDVLDSSGASLPHSMWTIAYVSSEETQKEDGSALNAINGQIADYWHTAWSQTQPPHPHRLVIDFGTRERISGFRYTPRPGTDADTGRIQKFRIYVGDKLAE